MTHRDSYFLDKMDTSKNKVTIMEMKINLDRLKSERNKRAWTQNHLAEVCGLSLRTIQRIEKTGSASNESIQALASVFSISIEDLLNGFETNADEINFESTPAINSRGKTFALIGLILLLVVPVIATMISLTGSSIIVEVSKGSTIRFVDSNYLTLMVHTSTGILTLIPSLFDPMMACLLGVKNSRTTSVSSCKSTLTFPSTNVVFFSSSLEYAEILNEVPITRISISSEVTINGDPLCATSK